MLAQRLRELETAGVARRYELDPPANVTVYELTDRGHALDPVLQALGRWGAQEPEVSGRQMSTTSFLRSLRMLVVPNAPDVTFGLTVAGEQFGFAIVNGAATVTRGRPTTPVATITGDVASLQEALLAGTSIPDLETSGVLAVTGDHRAAQSLPKLFSVPRQPE